MSTSAGSAARPAATESPRSAPPATTVTESAVRVDPRPDAGAEPLAPTLAAGGFGLGPVPRGRHDHDHVDRVARQYSSQSVPQDRLTREGNERLGPTGPQTRTGAGRDDDDADATGSSRSVHSVARCHGVTGCHSGTGCRSTQEARTSSRMVSAFSSSVFSASASSETRIWRALASIRFSPADRPRS